MKTDLTNVSAFLLSLVDVVKLDGEGALSELAQILRDAAWHYV